MKNDIATEKFSFIRRQWHKHKLPLKLFVAMCLNLIIASAVYATNEGDISQGQAYAIGLLLLVTFALSVYLFAVIFVPEKF